MMPKNEAENEQFIYANLYYLNIHYIMTKDQHWYEVLDSAGRQCRSMEEVRHVCINDAKEWSWE